MQGDGVIDDVADFVKKGVKKIEKTFRQRSSGNYPPKVRDFLSKNGNEKVNTLKVVRTPISNVLKELLNLVSLGNFEKAVKTSNYDKMFHLSLYINGKYILDKQEVVKLVSGNPIKGDSETMDISVSKDLSISEMLDKTKESVGNSIFERYDARKNNCQDFIINVLRANGLLNDGLAKFIKQDAIGVFKKMPKFVSKFSKVATDVGAVANKILEGENIISNNKMLKWKEYMSSEMKGKRFTGGRSEVNAYVKELATKFKELKKENVKENEIDKQDG